MKQYVLPVFEIVDFEHDILQSSVTGTFDDGDNLYDFKKVFGVGGAE